MSEFKRRSNVEKGLRLGIEIIREGGIGWAVILTNAQY